MSQPSGFPSPIEALLGIATCLGDFSILAEDGETTLDPEIFVGDYDVGGVIDCCPDSILRIESTGELPANGMPTVLGKHGCVEFVMGVRVTFLTCFKTMSKSGTVVTNAEGLAYNRVIQASRWEALNMLRCCSDAKTRQSIKFVNSQPINTDGKCSGWQIDLQVPLSLCETCESPS